MNREFSSSHRRAGRNLQTSAPAATRSAFELTSLVDQGRPKRAITNYSPDLFEPIFSNFWRRVIWTTCLRAGRERWRSVDRDRRKSRRSLRVMCRELSCAAIQLHGPGFRSARIRPSGSQASRTHRREFIAEIEPAVLAPSSNWRNSQMPCSSSDDLRQEAMFSCQRSMLRCVSGLIGRAATVLRGYEMRSLPPQSAKSRRPFMK